MQDKNFSIDDILDELNTNKLSPDEVEKIAKEYQKFDTNALLDEILHPDKAKNSAFALDEAQILKAVGEVLPDEDKTATPTKSTPPPVPQSTPEVSEQTKVLDKVALKKEAESSKDTPQKEVAPKAKSSAEKVVPKDKERTSLDKSEKTTDKTAKTANSTEEIKVPEQPTHDDIYHEKTKTLDSVYRKTKISQTDQPLFKKETVNQDSEPVGVSLHEKKHYEQAKKHNTNQLKYIALHRSRQETVSRFKLHAKFHTDSHNFSKEELANSLEEESVKQQEKLENAATELDAQQVKEITHSFKKIDSNETQNPIKKLSFQAKPNILSANTTEQSSDYSESSDSNNFLQWLREKRKFIFIRMCAIAFFLLITGAVAIFNTMPANPLLAFDKYANPLSFVLLNLVSLLVCAVLMYDVLLDGVACLALQKINKSTIFSLATLVLVIFNFTLVFNAELVSTGAVHIYAPFLLLNYLVVLYSKRQEISRIVKNFTFVGSDVEKYSTHIVEDVNLSESFTKGAVNSYPHFAVNTKTAFLKNFMTESLSEDLNDKKSKIVLPVISALAIALIVISYTMGFDSSQIFTVLTGILICAASGYTFLMISDPLLNACREVSKHGGAIVSYSAVEDFAQTNSALINANTLFETSDVVLYGIKTFPNIVIDRAILDATSVLCETKSILCGTFLNIIEDRKDYLAEVDTVIYEDGMGISAWVDNRRVLIGSRELMKNHNIDTPSRDYEKKFLSEDKNLVYLSTDGELSAVFIIGLNCNVKVRNMLVDLYNDDCVSIIKTIDPIITKSQLAKIFSMPEDAFKIISSRLHKDSEELVNSPINMDAKVCNNGNVFAYIYSLLWAKRLNKIISVGEILSFVMIGVNIALFLVFTLLNSTAQLDNRFLCIYQIIAVFVCVILQRLYKVR